jgi:hypothetical protein
VQAARLGRRGDGGPPRDARGAQPRGLHGREQAHDRGHRGGPGGHDGVELGLEVQGHGIARASGHLGAMLRQEGGEARLVRGVAPRGWIGHPQVQLQRGGRARRGAEARHPVGDAPGRQQQRAQGGHAAAAHHGRGQRRRGHAGHRRLQQRVRQPLRGGEAARAGQRPHGAATGVASPA